MTEITMKSNLKNGIINTYSGLLIDLMNPTVDMIDIRDIAKGLAYKGHFGGQTPFYFSIADHSLLVVKLMMDAREHDRDMLMLGLLHDASEAYIGDMVKPLKVHLDDFVMYEDQLTEVICERFNLDSSLLSEIKAYDVIAQQLEFETFFEGAEHLTSSPPDESVDNFLKVYEQIKRK